MLLTVNEIIKRFRTQEACLKFSPKTIHHMAEKIGYHLKRASGKVGYEGSLITAILRRLKEAVDYEKAISVKPPQKQNKPSNKQPRDIGYFGRNGERYNVDYDWEKDEGIIKRAIIESINKVLGGKVL